MDDVELERLIERAAPEPLSATTEDVLAMLSAAASASRPKRSKRIGGAVASLLSIVMVGVAGAAVADGIGWASWAQKPLGSVAFEMESGLSCELRFSEYRGGDDPDFIANVNGVLEDWYRVTDVARAMESQRGRTAINHAEVIDAPILLDGETLEQLPADEWEFRLHAREVFFWDLVISDLESEELERHGIEPDGSGFYGSERSGQIQCFDADGKPYLPGEGGR